MLDLPNPLVPKTVPQAAGAALIVAGALAALPVYRRLTAVPDEHRTAAMRHAQRDIRIGGTLLGIGLLIALGGGLAGWRLGASVAGQLAVMGGLGCLGIPGVAWLWSGRREAEEELAAFRDEAPWGTRAQRRRYAREQAGEPPVDGAA